MSTISIPRTPADITAEWLTAALRETDTIKQSTVTSFEMDADIAAGAGFMGQLARVKLRYDQAEPGAPQSLIATARGDALMLLVGPEGGLSERELASTK